jgi:hypothetical protein
MIYHQACLAISAHTVLFGIDDFLKFASVEPNYLNDSIIVNICGGLTDIAIASAVPCMSRHLNAPIYPSSVKNVVTTYDKLLSKHLAQVSGFRTPTTLTLDEAKSRNEPVISKPISGGDSDGIEVIEDLTSYSEVRSQHFLENFIRGADATLALIRSNGGYRPIYYAVSENGENDWYTFEMKKDFNLIYGSGEIPARNFLCLNNISDELLLVASGYLKKCGSPFLARIDFRQTSNNKRIELEDVVFLECNTSPTISNANDWFDGVFDYFSGDVRSEYYRSLSIHPAARSLAMLIDECYSQSLSIASNKPDFL